MGLLDIFGGGDSGFGDARDAVAKNRALYDAIKDPQYQQYAPDLYTNKSADYTLQQDNPLLKSAQMAALAKMSGLADSGLSDVDQAGFEKARSVAGQVQKQGQAAALQNAQSRGVGGSGMEFAMREMANQDAATRAQDAGLSQAAESARQRALYSQAYGQQLAGVRNQDASTAANNTGIINQFNMANTQAQNRTNNANVDQRNNAFQYNEGLKDRTFQNQMTRANGQASANNQLAQIGAAEADQKRARSRALMGLAGAGLGAAAGMGTPVGAAGGAQAGAGIGQLVGGV